MPMIAHPAPWRGRQGQHYHGLWALASLTTSCSAPGCAAEQSCSCTARPPIKHSGPQKGESWQRGHHVACGRPQPCALPAAAAQRPSRSLLPQASQAHVRTPLSVGQLARALPNNRTSASSGSSAAARHGSYSAANCAACSGRPAARRARTTGTTQASARRCRQTGACSRIQSSNCHKAAAARMARLGASLLDRPGFSSRSSCSSKRIRNTKECRSQARRKCFAIFAPSLLGPSSSSTTARSACKACSFSASKGKAERNPNNLCSLSRHCCLGVGALQLAHHQPFRPSFPSGKQKQLHPAQSSARVESSAKQRWHMQSKFFWTRSSSWRAAVDAISILKGK
mmetsp:Transcript_64026/g.187329  ORF Transcript_64026/g.187329 Transcript_64026/m.187329 type:complete len:341 (+) Transcript_64026:198-1220(+)